MKTPDLVLRGKIPTVVDAMEALLFQTQSEGLGMI